MAISAQELVAAARQTINEISVSTAQQKLNDSLLLDVREPAEFAAGHLPRAINIPRGLLEFQIAVHPVFQHAQAAEILVYCQSGGRSALATLVLNQMGYAKAMSVAGGFKAWADSGFDIERA